MAQETTNYPTTFETSFEPLTRRDLSDGVGRAAIDSLARHGFIVACGLREVDIRGPEGEPGDLAVMVHEPHIVEYCPNDRDRVGTVEAAADWLARGRGFVGVYATLRSGLLCDPDIREVKRDEVQMVAFGWSGRKPNGHIPGADITTAYRVGERGRELAYARRQGAEDRFKLGRPLGELVVATAVEIYGAARSRLSLETWESNKAAVNLYHDMGFVQPAGVEPIPSVRPTLRQPGEVVNGQTVYRYDDEGPALVRDNRLNMRLVDPVL